MTVIVMMNPKGGTGKTTSALLLAQALSKDNEVAIVDCDRNENILRWQESRRALDRAVPFSVLPAPAEDAEGVMDIIIDAEKSHDYVIVDLEGVKTQTATFALGRAHLVLIPIKPSSMEIALAGVAVQHIQGTSRVFQRELPFAILLNRTNAAFATHRERELRIDLDEAEVPTLSVSIMQREAYANMFEDGEVIEEMKLSDSARAKAIENRDAYADAVAAMIQQIKGS